MADSLRIVNQMIDRAVRDAARNVSDDLARQVAEAAPRRTGTLAKSIAGDVDVTPRGVTITVGPRTDAQYVDDEGRVHRPAKYAHLVERRQPFLRPVLDTQSDHVVDQFADSLRRGVASLDGK